MKVITANLLNRFWVNGVKPIKTAVGTISSLTTTAKTNLVAAINEVKAKADSNSTDITSLNNNLSGINGINQIAGESKSLVMYCPFIAVSSNSGYLILTLPFVTRNTSYSVEILSCDIRNLGIVNVGNVFVEGKLESSILLGVTSLPGTVAGYSCQAAVTFKLTFA